MRIRTFGLRVVLLLSGLPLTGCTSSAWQTANVLTDSCIRRAKLALRDVDFDQNRSMATDGSAQIVVGDHASYRRKCIAPFAMGRLSSQ
jgi:hypothetical protein